MLHEKNTLDLSVTNAIIYPVKKKSDAVYLRITSYCKQCQRVSPKNDKYDIHCQSRPSELDNDLIIEQYTTVTVECGIHTRAYNQSHNRSYQ